MQAGQLNKRVTLQRVANTRTSTGDVTQTWSTLGTRSALVEPLTGRELVEAQKTEAQATYRVRLRADSLTKALTAKDRICL